MERFTETFERLGLADKVTHGLAELSRGDVYRALLAPLFISRCTTILIDEPFSAGLDAAGCNALQKELRLAADEGKAVVYTAQLPEQIEATANRAILIENGEVVEDIRSGFTETLNSRLL